MGQIVVISVAHCGMLSSYPGMAEWWLGHPSW